jgi:hypothetical protein
VSEHPVERQLKLFPALEEVLNSFQYGVEFSGLHPLVEKTGKTFLQQETLEIAAELYPAN